MMPGWMNSKLESLRKKIKEYDHLQQIIASQKKLLREIEVTKSYKAFAKATPENSGWLTTADLLMGELQKACFALEVMLHDLSVLATDGYVFKREEVSLDFKE